MRCVQTFDWYCIMMHMFGEDMTWYNNAIIFLNLSTTPPDRTLLTQKYYISTQALGSVNRLETMLLFWHYMNQIELNL